jgi:hypothetical protein
VSLSDIKISSIQVPSSLKIKLFGTTPGVPASRQQAFGPAARAAIPAKDFNSDWMTGDQSNVGGGWNDKITKIEVAEV